MNIEYGMTKVGHEALIMEVLFFIPNHEEFTNDFTFGQKCCTSFPANGIFALIIVCTVKIVWKPVMKGLK